MQTLSKTIRPRRPFHRRRRATPQSPAPQPVEDVLTGMILPYGGASCPEGYLDCDGSAVSRETYAALFAVMGVAYGMGDGSTTFNVPDFRGRALVGAGTGSGLSNRNRGDIGGAETITLSVDQIPFHQHGYTQGSGISTSGGEASSGMGTSVLTGATLDSAPALTDQSGGIEAHPNMPPFGVVRWVVKC